jgi:hypothetical protein
MFNVVCLEVGSNIYGLLVTVRGVFEAFWISHFLLTSRVDLSM